MRGGLQAGRWGVLGMGLLCCQGAVLKGAAMKGAAGKDAAARAADYAVPASDALVLHGVDFARAQVIAPELTQVFQDCDQQTTRGGCKTDPAHHTVMLKFADTASAPGPVFFDAKMAIDADGSVLSKKAERPNQPETALRYPAPADSTEPPLSLDSERVPYIVMPMGGFRQASGVVLGDLAAVVKDGQVRFAIVGDVGPRTHIGEGSMYLHTLFGRNICQARDEAGNCSQFLDTSLEAPVLYFLFPGTKTLLFDTNMTGDAYKDALTPGNINARLLTVGQQVWGAFLRGQQREGKG